GAPSRSSPRESRPSESPTKRHARRARRARRSPPRCSFRRSEAMRWCACLFVLTTGIAACSRSASAPRHVVLVSIDTLRADRLGAYGSAQPTSPTIDALAAESTVFESAVATCPATAPSLASILTGTHRANHRVFGNGWTLPSDVETIAEILKA